MPLNHTFSIAMCNTKLIFKLALFLLILAVLFVAIFTAILHPILSNILTIVSETEINAGDFINHPFVTFRTQILQKCFDYLKTIDLGATTAYIIVTYFFLRFFSLIPQLPVTKVLYNKMTSGYDIGLVSSIISTGFQNLLLSFILAFITTVLNGGLFVGLVALFLACSNTKYFLVLPVIIIIYLCLVSVVSCLFSQWMPEICASQAKNIFIGIKNAFKGTFAKFRKNFLCFFTLNVIWFGVVAATIIPTLGTLPLILIPAFVVMRSILSLTLNFSYHKQKYFVDNGTTIYTPTKLF